MLTSSQMVCEYDQENYNHVMQPNPQYHEEEPHNSSVKLQEEDNRSEKASSLFLDYCKTKMTLRHV